MERTGRRIGEWAKRVPSNTCNATATHRTAHTRGVSSYSEPEPNLRSTTLAFPGVDEDCRRLVARAREDHHRVAVV